MLEFVHCSRSKKSKKRKDSQQIIPEEDATLAESESELAVDFEDKNQNTLKGSWNELLLCQRPRPEK
jgi:hypothetical protein